MANSTYQMAVNTNVGGQFCSNVLHFEFDDAGYGSSAQAALALNNGWIATGGHNAFKALCSSHTTFLSLRSRKINSVGGFEAVNTFAAGVVGGRAGILAAAGLSAVLIIIPSGNAKERGRIFLPGLSDTDCQDGIYQAGFITAMGANVPTLFAPFVLAGGGAPTATMKLYSRKLHLTRSIQLIQLSLMVGQVRRRQLPA